MQSSYSQPIMEGGVMVALLSIDISEVDRSEYGMEPGWLYINRIYITPTFRGRGHAREAMAELCADADSEGRTLALLPVPYDAADNVWILPWYERMGFVGNSDGIMVRLPRGDRVEPVRDGQRSGAGSPELGRQASG